MKIKISGLFEPSKEVDPFTWRDSMDQGSVVHYCVEKNKMALLKKVLANEPKMNALLDQKIVNVINRHGQTPIQQAILEKKNNFVEFLIDQKCDQNTTDKEGKTLYHYALMSGYKGLEFEKTSSYMLCSYGKERLLVVVVDELTDAHVKAINERIVEYKLKKVKIYMRTMKAKDEIQASVYVAEKSSLGKNASFICYL